MTQASSVPTSSLSSVLADALARSSGVYSSVSTSYIAPVLRAITSAKYTQQIQEEASSPDIWGEASKFINVTIDENDRVSVSAQGNSEQVALAEALEYGTPESPPVAVMRTYEVMFNEDYSVNKGSYSL